MAQVCGAVIRMGAESQSDANVARGADEQQIMSLRSIRSALQDAGAIPVYMFPLLLRVLGDEEALPLTHSGKVGKGAALKEFFGGKDVHSTRCLPEKVEVWHRLPSSDEMGAIKGDGAVKTWDWAGLQSA